MNLLDLDQQYLWHPFTALKEKYPPLLVEKAQGCELLLADGRTIIDAVSSWWTNIHGHGNKDLLEVIQNQALTIDHVIFAGFTHKPAIELAQKLILATENNFSKVFYSDDGSTAVEVGLKMALQYWTNIGKPKKKILALEGAYHGDTFGSMSLAGKSDFFAAFNSMLFDVETLPFPATDSIDLIEEKIDFLSVNQEVACVVLEPKLQGSAGMRIYSEELLQRIFKKCQQNEILIVADEVLTGFGRTGTLFASILGEIKPDVMALSKGLTGGVLPLGVTLANQKVVSAFDNDDKKMTFYHGHSFTANAITCALACKSLELLQGNERQTQIKNLCLKQKEAQIRFSNHGKIKESRVLGTVLALEIENGGESSYFSDLRTTLYQKAIQKGVLLRPLGNVLYVLPPYTIKDQELEKIYDSIDEILHEI
jgi:adenosylmethionine-8-amino-7-oxononanoate aminotransferase